MHANSRSYCAWESTGVTERRDNAFDVNQLSVFCTACKDAITYYVRELVRIKSVSKYGIKRIKVLSGVLTFCCRSSAIYRWRCWRKCCCRRSWCCMRVTMRVMTTASHTSLASPEMLVDERLHCCLQWVGNGVRLSLVGHNHLLVIGWKSWIDVSSHTLSHVWVGCIMRVVQNVLGLSSTCLVKRL